MNFLKKIIIPRMRNYHLIIGVHVDCLNIKSLDNFIKKEKPINSIFLVSSPTQNDRDYKTGLVTMFSNRNNPIQISVNIGRNPNINSDQSIIIYQNLFRDKLI